MKNLLLILIFMMSIEIIAQPPSHEKMEALKVSFITNQLDLSTKEAQQFWPIYNAMEKELKALRKNPFPKGERKPIEDMSESELNQLITSKISKLRKEADLLETYYKKFKGVLPTQKIAKLYDLERKFKRMLLERVKGGKAPSK